MKRHAFIEPVGAGPLQRGPAGQGKAQTTGRPCEPGAPPAEVPLAGMSLTELRESLHDQLFKEILPFWAKYGIDEKYGGILCSLDYDGTRVSTEKILWFLGRAIWVYSFLYNHFGKDPQYLEVARNVKEFVFTHALQEDGWWAEELSRQGEVLRPFSGDTEGMYFIVEGLQEYAVASGDDQSREYASTLLKKLFRYFNSPDFRYQGADFLYLWNSKQAVRPQGLWFLNLNISTQMLMRWNDPEISAMTDDAVDAIMNKHYRSDIGLNTEMLYFDFTRPPGEERKVRIGHSIEALWMVMDEADRRRDATLWQTCAERILHHIEVGWDYVYGGISQWINVDQPCYQWPVETPVGTGLEFHFVGEYEYMKTQWGLNEVMIATLKVFERTGAEWAARYFGMAHEVIEEKFSQKKRGYPAGRMQFADRRMTLQPHVSRQDNYHSLRQLMFNILALDRMIAHGVAPFRPAGDA
jgi:N-acylglucosamine 2-epimerase